MSEDEAIDLLAHAAKHKPAALLAWAAALAIKHPEDVPHIKTILIALLK